ncbi:hypothetical protein [Cupriavidus pampae]|nr:hypothetical protein [Cupriavidus pampae]
MDTEPPLTLPSGLELPLHARVAVLEAVIAVADLKVVAARLVTCLEEAMQEVGDATPTELRVKLEGMRLKLLQPNALPRRQQDETVSSSE